MNNRDKQMRIPNFVNFAFIDEIFVLVNFAKIGNWHIMRIIGDDAGRQRSKKMNDDNYTEYLRKHSYVDRRILDGETRKIVFPDTGGIPKTRVHSEHIPSPLIAAFGLPEDNFGDSENGD